MIKQKHGFTIIEAVASIFIVTLVLTTAMAIVLNMRNQAMASEQKIKATDAGSLIRNDISRNYIYRDINDWLDDQSKTLTYDDCTNATIDCSIFNDSNDERYFDNEITITFIRPTSEDISLKAIRYEITITYFKERTLTMIGVIYEKA